MDGQEHAYEPVQQHADGAQHQGVIYADSELPLPPPPELPGSNGGEPNLSPAPEALPPPPPPAPARRHRWGPSMDAPAESGTPAPGSGEGDGGERKRKKKSRWEDSEKPSTAIVVAAPPGSAIGSFSFPKEVHLSGGITVRGAVIGVTCFNPVFCLANGHGLLQTMPVHKSWLRMGMSKLSTLASTLACKS